VSGVSVHVLTYGLAEKFAVLKDREAKRAQKAGVSKTATKGKSIARSLAPEKSGKGKRGILKTSASGGGIALAKVYLSGPHAHIMYWQDQGTGKRYKKDGQSTGRVEPQYFMERATTTLRDGDWLNYYMERELEAAIIRSGLA
jgi:hypothetical protein